MNKRSKRILVAGVLIVGMAVSAGVNAHGQGHGRSGDAGPCNGEPGMMGSCGGQGGMMGQGMHHQGMGGQAGMMGQGMHHQGMGGQAGMMGRGMHHQGMGRGRMMKPDGGMHGRMGVGVGPGGYLDRHLSPDDVKEILEHRLSHKGNDRLRVGKVETNDKDHIVADIETVDGSLVEQIEVDPHTGFSRRVN